MIWCILGLVLSYYLCVTVFRLAVTIPVRLAFLVCLPVMPFVVAYRNRKEHPVLAKTIVWLWGIFYSLWILLIVCLDGHL